MQAACWQRCVMDKVILRDFHASDAAWLAGRHGLLYARDEGFDASFERLVAEIIAGFLAEHDPMSERGWIAERDGARLGSIFCVRAGAQTAKLRLFLVTPGARGLGLGRRLLERCMTFAKDSGYQRMELWTHESHKAACALYAKTGWQLASSTPVHSFGVDLIEQSWKIEL